MFTSNTGAELQGTTTGELKVLTRNKGWQWGMCTGELKVFTREWKRRWRGSKGMEEETA